MVSDLIEVPASGEATIGSPIKTVQEGVISFLNTTTIPLGANASFIGSAIDVKDFATISLAVASNVASATNGLRVEFSPDGIHWDHIHAFNVPAEFSLSYNVSTELRFMRIVYNNGASAQSYFRLTTILKRMQVPPSEYTLAQTVRDETLASVTKSVIVGKTTGGGGGFVAVKVNPSGAITGEVSVTESVLPDGAATESTLDAIRINIDTVTPEVMDIANYTEYLNDKVAASLVPDKHDNITITYVGATTDINTVTFKDGVTTVATLTMGYDGSNRLQTVTRT